MNGSRRGQAFSLTNPGARPPQSGSGSAWQLPHRGLVLRTKDWSLALAGILGPLARGLPWLLEMGFRLCSPQCSSCHWPLWGEAEVQAAGSSVRDGRRLLCQREGMQPRELSPWQGERCSWTDVSCHPGAVALAAPPPTSPDSHQTRDSEWSLGGQEDRRSYRRTWHA